MMVARQLKKAPVNSLKQLLKVVLSSAVCKGNVGNSMLFQ